MTNTATITITVNVPGHSARGVTGSSLPDAVEQIFKNRSLMDELQLSGTAGHVLHGLHMGQPVDSGHDGRGAFWRAVTVRRQSMQTMPQERKGEVNPITEHVIKVFHGPELCNVIAHDWQLDGDKLVAQPRL